MPVVADVLSRTATPSLVAKFPGFLSSDAAPVVMACRCGAHALPAASCREHILRGARMPLRTHSALLSNGKAGTGAVLSVSRLGAGDDDHERLPTGSTRVFNTAGQLPVLPNDMRFASTDLLRAPAVASMAARHQVAEVVVAAVSVEVVNRKLATSNPVMSDRPRHVIATPMARMRSGSDRVEQHQPMLGDEAVLANQRVVRAVEPSISSTRHSGEWYQ